jgi:hypothetical protein
MKKINIKGLLFIGLLFAGVSCQKEYEKEYSWAHPVSGDWTVNIKAGEDDYGNHFITIYNTSFGKDSIWIDDNSFWPFKAKAKADMKNLNFGTTAYTSLPGNRYEDEVSIKNAKIVNKDSIYFEVEFGSDAGVTYQYAGHRRLSYEEYNSH